MMKLFLLLSFSIVGLVCEAQQYFNSHYQIEESNVSPINLKIYENQLVCTYLNGDSLGSLQSGLAILNKDNSDFIFKHISNFRIADSGFSIYQNQSALIFGKATDSDINLTLIELNLTNFEIVQSFEYQSNLSKNFPFAGDHREMNLYQGYYDENVDSGHREFGIVKLSYDGNLEWQKNFNSHFQLSNLYSVKVLDNESIFTSSRIWRVGEFLRLPQILKIDENGEVIDSVIGQRETFETGTDVPMIILDQNKIVQAYKRKGPLKDYIWMDFYDADLNLLFSKNLTTWAQEDLSTYHLKEGKGDYFFIIGSYTNFDERRQYGSIIKLDHSGNVIWRHRYLHPDFVDDEHAYTVKDLVEEDNGNIYCMGSIKPVNQLQRLWLFKINEQGCLGDQNCEELVITDVEEEELSVPTINIFPNPAHNTLQLEIGTIPVYSISIVDYNGKEITSMKTIKTLKQIDVSYLKSGMYFIQMHTDKGVISKRFVKL